MSDSDRCSCCLPFAEPDEWSKQDPGERVLNCMRCGATLGMIHERARLVYTETTSRVGCDWWAWPSALSGHVAEKGEAGTWDEAHDAVIGVLGASP